MFERLERPLKIVCLAMAALLAWQLGYLILRGDPLAHLKIPALPALPGSTDETAKLAPMATNSAEAKHPGTSGTNVASGTHSANSTNALAKSTNAAAITEAGGTNGNSGPKSGNPQKPGPNGSMPSLPPGMPPGMMAQMVGGGMPGGPNGGGMKKIELPPEAQSRVDRIIDSEVFGPVMRPMPMALLGIADQEAFIQATNGQVGPVKLGGEMAGIKLLRIGINRVLVEQDGEKKELTLFGGIGGESLMPDPAGAPATSKAATNSPSTNAPIKKVSFRSAPGPNALANQNRPSTLKETP